MSYIDKPSLTKRPNESVRPKEKEVQSECSHNYRIVETDVVTAHADNLLCEKRIDILFYCTKCLELKRKVETMKGV